MLSSTATEHDLHISKTTVHQESHNIYTSWKNQTIRTVYLRLPLHGAYKRTLCKS